MPDPCRGLVIAEQIKPKQISFLIETAGPGVTLAVLLAVGAGLTLALLDRAGLAAIVAGGLAVIGGAIFCDALVAYRKERYLFFDHQIVRKGGGVLRDSHTELNVTNVTHVKLVLPWPRYRLFGVGYVVIDSAGSGEHMQLRALADPLSVYERVRTLMRHNGFPLTYAHRLHEEQPPAVAVVREIGGELVGAGMLMFVIGLPLAAGLTALSGRWGIFVAIAGVLLLFGGFGSLLLVRALDLKRRTYTVYSDVVVYTEGFLTRHNAFIPAENLADSNTQQSLFDRILGLYDVTLSCQGSGQEIVFRGLRDGPRLSRALDEAASTSRPMSDAGAAPPTAQPGEAPSFGVPEAAGAPTAGTPAASTTAVPAQSVAADAATAAPLILRMYPPRALAPYFLGAVVIAAGLALWGSFAAPLVWLLAMVGGSWGVTLLSLGLASSVVRGMLTIFVTRFEFGPRSVKRRYRLLQAHETEYSNDKLTGIVYRTNLLDRWFGTCTLRFWSIGASNALVFSHVRDRDELLTRALRHAGIDNEHRIEQPRDEMPSLWSLRVTAAESLPMIALWAVVVLCLAVAARMVSPWFWTGLVVVAAFWTLVLTCEPIYYRRCRARFHARHLEVRKGVLTRDRYHALYRNVKHVTTVRYPFTDHGRVQFQVAGHGSETAVVIGFVDALTARNEMLDRLLKDQTSAEQIAPLASTPERERETPVRVSRPALANTLVPLIGVSIVLLPLAALLPVTIPWAIVAVRRRRYRIESDRVVACWGVIFAHQTSIGFEKIDHIQQGQGLLNKMFGNGNIRIYTSGSSEADLAVRHIADYQAFYEELRQHYVGGGH